MGVAPAPTNQPRRFPCTSASTASSPGSPTRPPVTSSAPRSGSSTCSRRSSSPTRSGLYSFGIGEHHREEYYDSAPPVILAAAAARTTSHPARQRGDGAQRRRPGAGLPAVRDARPDLEAAASTSSSAAARSPRRSRSSASTWPTTTRCSPRSSTCCCRSGSRPHVTWSGQHRAPAHRSGRLPATGAGPAADLGRGRRDARVVRPRRAARSAADGRDHRRRAAPLRPARRPLPPGGRAGRSRARDPAGRPARLRLRRREPSATPPTRSTRAGTRCSPRPPASVASRRPTGRSSTPPADRTARSSSATPTTIVTKLGRVADQLGGVDRVVAADDQPAPGPRRPAARHRAARHRGRAAGRRPLMTRPGPTSGG